VSQLRIRQLHLEADPAPAVPEQDRACDGGPVEFERVVRASGTLRVARGQFWLGRTAPG
jgi:hypothetical protein